MVKYSNEAITTLYSECQNLIKKNYAEFAMLTHDNSMLLSKYLIIGFLFIY
jgi:hypothetical protein